MDTLRVLLRLKLKLQWRSYTRNTTTIIGIVVLVLLLAPMAVGVAVGCYLGFRLDPPANAQLLATVLLLGYTMWLVMPVVRGSLTEAYDVTRLFHFPVSPGLLFAGAVLGSFVDLFSLLAAPTLVAVIAAFTTDAVSLVLITLAMLLFVFHTLALSQVIMLAGSGILRSRRFRDLLLLLVPLLSMALWLVTQLLARGAGRFASQPSRLHALLDHPAWRVVDLLPPGWATRAVANAGDGRVLPALGFVALLAAVCVGTVSVASWLVQLVSSGHVVSAPARRVRPEAAMRRGAARTPTPDLLRRMPPVVAAVAGKELKYVAREPYFRNMLMGIAFMLVVAVVMFLRPANLSGAGLPESFRRYMVWPATGFVLTTEGQLLMNFLGTEGKSVLLLLLLPASRRQILIGKNLAVLGALTVTNVVVVSVICTISGMAPMIPIAFVWMELALVVLAAVGNLSSILFPIPIVRVGWRVQYQMTGQAFVHSMAHLLCIGVGGVVLLPVLAAVLVPACWVAPFWYGLTLPLAAGYVIGVYLLSLHVAAPLLLAREPELIGLLVPEEQ